MPFECITLDFHEEGIALLTLNRPQRLNAFNRQMISEWREALEQVALHPHARVLVLTGAGRALLQL
ncbi:MAG: enoyl-CoA hydratase-related protein, partial [Betaproteobacteria bacterium]